MREILSVVALALLGLLCLDFAADAAVKEQERSRAEAAALRALAAANEAKAAADGAEWAAYVAASTRDTTCACEWSMVESDPAYPKLKDTIATRCKGGDECHLRWAWTAGVPLHGPEP